MPINFMPCTVYSPFKLGPLSHACRYCGALFWYEERVKQDRHASSPVYTKCCKKGSVILPRDGHRPEYAQLYIFDTDNEVRNRMNVASYTGSNFSPRQDTVAALIDMFNTHNPIVQLFRTARDRIVGSAPDKYVIRLYGEPDKHGDIFSAPVASEVVGLVVGDVGQSDGGRDLIVEDQSGQLQRVDEKHRKFMAMQYPILFPYGEDGYHEKINYRQCHRSRAIKRNNATMLE